MRGLNIVLTPVTLRFGRERVSSIITSPPPLCKFNSWLLGQSWMGSQLYQQLSEQLHLFLIHILTYTVNRVLPCLNLWSSKSKNHIFSIDPISHRNLLHQCNSKLQNSCLSFPEIHYHRRQQNNNSNLIGDAPDILCSSLVNSTLYTVLVSYVAAR